MVPMVRGCVKMSKVAPCICINKQNESTLKSILINMCACNYGFCAIIIIIIYIIGITITMMMITV